MKKIILLLGLIGCLPKPIPPIAPVEINIEGNYPKTEFKKVQIIRNYHWTVAPTVPNYVDIEVVSDKEIIYKLNSEALYGDIKSIKVIATVERGALILLAYHNDVKEITNIAICNEDNSVFEFTFMRLSFVMNCHEFIQDVIEELNPESNNE